MITPLDHFFDPLPGEGGLEHKYHELLTYSQREYSQCFSEYFNLNEIISAYRMLLRSINYRPRPWANVELVLLRNSVDVLVYPLFFF